MPVKKSAIVIRYADGSLSDRALHEGILSPIDDTPLRIRSAQRVMNMGFTRAEAESLFKVVLPRDDDKAK